MLLYLNMNLSYAPFPDDQIIVNALWVISDGLSNVTVSDADLCNQLEVTHLENIEQMLQDTENNLKDLAEHVQNHMVTETVGAAFAAEVERLKFLFSYGRETLQWSSDGKVVKDASSREWAEAVLSLREDGVRQVMMTVHDMLSGSDSITGRTKPFLKLYIQSFPVSASASQMIKPLHTLESAGHSCWVLALAMKEDYDKVCAQVLPLARRMYSELDNTILLQPLMLHHISGWPVGGYGLVQVNGTGCPAGHWLTSKRFHGTAWRNTKSSPNHMALTESDDGMEWEFCTHDFSSGPSWPSGSFCVFSYHECPTGFNRGKVYWDDLYRSTTRNHSTQWESVPGALPDGTFGVDTSFYFCCRSDGSADTVMDLPVNKPFILFRYGGRCQQVRGMTVSEEWFKWAGDPQDNISYRTDAYPDGNLDRNYIELQMCYYSQDI